LSTSKSPGEPNQPPSSTKPEPGGRSSSGMSGPQPSLSTSRAAAFIPFRDPDSGQRLLSRVRQRLSRNLAGSLRALLTESPDPDSALMLFERLIGSPETLRLLELHPSLAHYAVVVFGHSRFLGETLIQNTDVLHSLLRERNLDQSFSREEFHEALARYRSRSFEADATLLLARFKRREYIRIMLRDVLKIAPLAETTAEISALADVLIEEALREADTDLLHRYDPPQHLDAVSRLVNTPFAILSLGKLGGNELNYSSDVDLMFVFGDGEAPPWSAMANREYFVRLAQRVTEILSTVTSEGPVFRIDLRLRPQGGEGELAVSFSHALRYYANEAHDWERQALIKVRYSAGDPPLARAFIRAVQPHVYTEQVNFAAIKTALLAREKMHARRHQLPALEPPGESINVKVDRGGIRDIEFLVQCLQRVYGGAEPWLRSGGTMFSLQKLHDKGHISGKEFHDLTSAYQFLRHLEHRLQLRHGQQTHRLPTTEAGLRILERSMEGYAPGEYRYADLVTLVEQRMAAVAEIYRRIIYQQQSRSHREALDAPFELRGPLEPGAVDQSNQQILERLAIDSPTLRAIATRPDVSSQARANMFRFLWSAFTSSERYAALIRHPEAVARALTLFDSSDYLTDILVRHPEEIATLADLDDPMPSADSGNLFGTSMTFGRATSDPVFAYLADSTAPYGEKLSLLRKHYRHRVFSAGARDITELRDVYTSLASTTSAAEDAITAAFNIAGAPEGLAVMALGRLGSGEFDLLSDADLLFVCAEQRDLAPLMKATEQMMQALAAYTREGMVFPVDTRLRPRGGEGELLVTPTQLAVYFEQEAQPWEALMYTKLRFLAGSQSLGTRAAATSRDLFQRFAGDSSFRRAARDMRAKLDAADASERSFKTSPGGVYDIDFITAYLFVHHGLSDTTGSMRDRLWRCVDAGLLNKADAAALDHAAELLRTVEHVVRLVAGRARKWLPPTEHARRVTQHLVSQILRQSFPQGLEAELIRSCERTRDIFFRVC
jgi:[glutamine synthetase] adenylyltransferase / [glutamine synthetase]-adenylyl-L-tyrosine phosphorylase